jgi:hypothetical protein
MSEWYAQGGDPARVYGVKRLQPGARFGSHNCRIERVAPTHTFAPGGMLTRDWRYAAVLLQRLPGL